MNDLFRREAVEHRTKRLAGAVILATPASTRLLGLLLAFIVFAAGAFASLSSYARKETVVGWVTPDQGLIRAVASQGGRIQSIAVHEGDLVAAGAEIASIRVSSDIAEGDAGAVLVAGLSAEAQAIQISADASTARLEAETRQLRGHLSNIVAERREAERQITLQVERVRIAQSDAERSATLAEQGFFPRRELEARQGAAFAAEQDLATLRQRKLSLDGEIIDVRSRIEAIPIETSATGAASAITQAQLDQRRADAQSRTQYVVRAAVAGRIAALPARAGQSIAPGAAVAAIVPEGSRLEAELYVPSRAAGFIRAGQEVRLLYQAFPHQRFGAGAGVVEAVSRTVLAPSEVAIPGVNVGEPVFRVQVHLARGYVEAYGQRTPLQPGMLLSADVIIDRRTLLEWLLDPLYAAGRR